MYYGKIKPVDIANGEGVRVSLFVSGCPHHCKGCFNPELWNYHAGESYTIETTMRILSLCYKPYITGLSLLGGEPLEPQNQAALLPFPVRFPIGRNRTLARYNHLSKQCILQSSLRKLIVLGARINMFFKI